MTTTFSVNMFEVTPGPHSQISGEELTDNGAYWTYTSQSETLLHAKAARGTFRPQVSDIASVSFEHNTQRSDTNLAYLHCIAYDDQDQIVHSWANHEPINQNNWHSITLHINASNVAKISVNVSGSGTDEYIDHFKMRNITYTYDAPDAPLNDGDSSCDEGNPSGDSSLDDPISIRTGEKRERTTDISLNTPAGQLAFTRQYRQSKQDTFDGMGLGWTHNHLSSLSTVSGSPNKVIIRLQTGGESHFEETTTDHYEGVAGVQSVVDYDSVADEYTLTTQAQNKFVFNASGKLISRIWHHGDTWTYNYYTSGHADGLLKEVTDGYGYKLQFTYIDNVIAMVEQFDHQQLWRVGDQTATGLDGGSPSGRYVEYDYVINKVDSGGIIDGSDALLNTVKDVLGNVWTYSYEQSDTDSLNYLIKVESPSVDSDGDGTADGKIILKDLTYTLSSGDITNITQKRGKQGSENYLIETDYAFQPNGDNKTTVTVAGKTTTYNFENGVSVGVEDPMGNISTQLPNSNYQPEFIEDANGNSTRLIWNNDGTSLLTIIDANGNETTFTYNSDGTLKESVGAEGNKTNYIYDPNSRQPRLILVSPNTPTEIDINGDMELDSGWTDVNTPTTNARVSTKVENGDYGRHVVTDAASEGIESTTWDLIANQSYRIHARVYPVTGTVKMQLHDESAVISGTAVTSSGGTDGWETLSLDYTPIAAKENITLQFLAASGAGEFYLDSVLVRLHDSIDVEGDMETTTGWANVGTPTTNARVNDAGGEVHSGDYSRHVVTDAADEGIESTTWDMVKDQTYTLRAKVYALETPDTIVKMRLVDDTGTPISGAEATTNAQDAWDCLSIVYTPSASNIDNVKVQFLTDGASGEFYVDTLTVDVERDMTETLKGDMTVDAGWSDVNTPTTNAQCIRVDSGTYFRHVEDADTDEGIESASVTLVDGKTYLVSARVFPVTNTAIQMAFTGGTGFDATSTTGALNIGQWQTLRAIHTVDNADDGSQKLRFTAQADNAEFYVDSIHLIDLGVISGEIAEQVRWQEFIYDNKGRTLEQATLNVTDATPIQRSSQSYHLSGHGFGLLAKTTQHSADGVGDDRTTEYSYDTAGRVVKAHQLSMFGACQTNYTVYDVSGNVLASICEYENTGAPPLTAEEAVCLYDPASPDKNKVTTHAYDEMGRRVKTTTNAGTSIEQTALTIYDSLSRVRMTIGNYKAQGSSTPGNWEWANNQWEDGEVSPTAISHGSEETENIISETIYNTRGLVESQRDPLGHVSRMVYDDAGRAYLTIRNYVPQGSTDPEDWVWSATNDRWEDGSNNAIDHGTNNDQNLIAEQTYDPAGNLVKFRDVRGVVSFTAYDALNRPIKTIQGASDPDYNILSDLDLSDYTYSTDPDKDVVSETTYDTMGRVLESKRLLENRGASEQWVIARSVYDKFGRQIRSIANYVEQGSTDPADWVWDDNDNRWEDGSSNAIDHGNNDQNLITETKYDDTGRLLTPVDIDRNEMHYVYDGMGRQVLTVTNYDGSGDPAKWNWSGAQWEDGEMSPAAISFGTENDQNVISETTYNGDGRVLQTRDVLGRVTYLVYDTQGRQTRLVQNYVPQFDSTPEEITPDKWVWSDVNDRWEQGASDTTAIARGTNYDQNIVTETVYDDLGRMQQSIDARRNVTYIVYSEGNRRRLSIGNYVEQGSSNPEDWEWMNNQWEDGNSNAISHGTNNDQNRISETTYDLVGRVEETRAVTGLISTQEYDALGRRVKSVVNHVDGTYSSSTPDEDLISQTEYNIAGQVTKTIDARGTETTFIYDTAGRRLTVTAASNTGQAVTNYTCYDKTGRVLRSIQNYVPILADTSLPAEAKDGDGYIKPDVWDSNGDWYFQPNSHGNNNDRNLITEYTYNNASRRLTVTNAMGNVTETAYAKNGQVQSVTQKDVMVNGSLADVATHYRYDKLRRRNLVVQNYVVQGTSEPENWIWDTNQWEDGASNAISHGSDNDQNIIVQIAHDVVGRMTSMRNPRGKETTYTYDNLNRRLSLTNPLSKVWSIAYADLTTGGTRTTMTYPGVNGGGTYDVTRDADPMGRLISIGYNDPANTPDVDFTYDLFGNRTKMIEYNNSSHVDANRVRETSFTYDDMRRLTSVEFAQNTSGDGSTLESVEQVDYEYDAGGLRTKMTLPGSLDITYEYNQRGQLIAMTDWDNQKTTFDYDGVGRHITTLRDNQLRSRYAYDAGGRLKRLRHTQGQKTLGDFQYTVDARGNRTQAQELIPHPATTNDTTITYDSDNVIYKGTWSTSGGFEETTNFGANLKLFVFGDTLELTIGTGPDHSIFDVYIGKTLWQSIDGYASSTGNKVVAIDLKQEGPHLLELRNRHDHNAASSDYKLRFKQLVVVDTEYDLHTTQYEYDAISRLLKADYYPGDNVNAIATRDYDYTYDVAGNRTYRRSKVYDNSGDYAILTNDYDYNDANQLIENVFNTAFYNSNDVLQSSSGSQTDYTYDNNGNLTTSEIGMSVTGAYTWDRANRQLTAPGSTSYAYDGLGNRVQQTVSSVVTDYLLDVQPGLTKILAKTTSGDTDRFVHGLRGIHAMEYNGGDWSYLMQDGLGSARAEVDANNAVLAMQNYTPYGNPFGTNGAFGSDFGFTGEQTDDNGQVYLRVRYYNPDMGTFSAFDPFEGRTCIPMSLNGYSWVESNVINQVDPSGATPHLANTSLAKMLNFGLCPEQSIQYILDGPGDENFGLCENQCRDLTDGNILTTARIFFECMRQCQSGILSPLRLFANRLVNCITPQSYANDGGECALNGLFLPEANMQAIVPNHAVHALSLLIDYAGRIYPSLTTKQILDNISEVLLGNRGSTTILMEGAVEGLTQYGLGLMGMDIDLTNNHELVKLNGYSTTGFHEDYFGESNALRHFWGYFNTRAQGGAFGVALGDIVHECFDIPEGGRSVVDARLTTVAERIGEIAPYSDTQSLGWLIQYTLTSPWGYVLPDNCLLPYYYNLNECKDLAIAHHTNGGIDMISPYEWMQPYRTCANR